MRNGQFSHRVLFLVCILFVVYALFPLTIYANSAPPGPYLSIGVYGLPENAVYADILIPLSTTDKAYVGFNEENGSAYFIGPDSEIASFSQDGYRSFTFHYFDADFGMQLSYMGSFAKPPASGEFISSISDSEVVFLDLYRATLETKTVNFFDFLEEYRSVRIALLDTDGNILLLTDPISVVDEYPYTFYNDIEIDGRTGIVLDNGQRYTSFASFRDTMSRFVSTLLLMAFSIGIETLIALFVFKLPHIGKILLLNLCTQVFLQLFVAWGVGVARLSYWPVILVGEVCVYVIEYIALRKLYKDVSHKKLIGFVLVANTASLVLGFLYPFFAAQGSLIGRIRAFLH